MSLLREAKFINRIDFPPPRWKSSPTPSKQSCTTSVQEKGKVLWHSLLQQRCHVGGDFLLVLRGFPVLGMTVWGRDFFVWVRGFCFYCSGGFRLQYDPMDSYTGKSKELLCCRFFVWWVFLSRSSGKRKQYAVHFHIPHSGFFFSLSCHKSFHWAYTSFCTLPTKTTPASWYQLKLVTLCLHQQIQQHSKTGMCRAEQGVIKERKASFCAHFREVTWTWTLLSSWHTSSIYI